MKFSLTAAIRAALANRLALPQPAQVNGAPFVQHTATPERKQRRDLVRALGRRQALKFIKAQRRTERSQ